MRLRTSHVAVGLPTTLRLGADAVEIDEPSATVLREVSAGTTSTLREPGIADTVDSTIHR